MSLPSVSSKLVIEDELSSPSVDIERSLVKFGSVSIVEGTDDTEEFCEVYKEGTKNNAKSSTIMMTFLIHSTPVSFLNHSHVMFKATNGVVLRHTFSLVEPDVEVQGSDNDNDAESNIEAHHSALRYSVSDADAPPPLPASIDADSMNSLSSISK
jgi:hypothetical protein